MADVARNDLILGEYNTCNTLDRNNVRAMKDCGLGEFAEYEEDFSEAVRSLFELEYWTYTRSNDGQDCMKKVFP
jgi:hypothetical protein